MIRYLCILLCTASLSAQELPDAPSRYPRALFVLESSALAAAIVENGRATVQERYGADGRELPRQSVGKYVAINGAIGAGSAFAAWKLEKSKRKAIRAIGHLIMWGAIGGYSASYFRK